MENFADVVNKITCLCVTIAPWSCQILKKGERDVTMAQFIGDKPAGSLPGWTRG
jgi:hypothetical protein